MSGEALPTVAFGRRQAKGFLLGFSAPVAVTAGLAVLLVGISVFVAGGRGILVTSMVWAPMFAVVLLRWQGRPLVESLPILGQWQLRKAMGQTQFRVRPAKPRPAGTMGLPGDAAALRFYEHPDGPVMVLDPYARTLTAVVHVSHSAFVLLDVPEQAQRVHAWGRVLASLAQAGSIAAVQVLESVVPDPGRGVSGWWDEHGVHDDSWASVNYGELLRVYGPAAATHRTFVSVALDLSKAKKQIAQVGRGIAAQAEVLAGELRNVKMLLQNAGLRVEGVLSARQLGAVVRGAYDPVIALVAGDAGTALSLGPAAVDEAWDYIRHDGGFSTTLWISEWPSTDSHPAFLHPLLFAQNVRRSFSLVAVPLSAATALREIRKEKVEYMADLAQKSEQGRIIAESDKEEFADVMDRERALIRGHADLRFCGFITVTADSLEGLRTATGQVQLAATRCMVETQVLYGRQAQAFVCGALPLGRTV